jgi:hypothetical protein
MYLAVEPLSSREIDIAEMRAQPKSTVIMTNLRAITLITAIFKGII